MMVLFVYAVLVFLVLRFSVTLFNFISNPKLGSHGGHFSEKVIVVIDNSADASARMKSLKALSSQDYQNIEVVFLDPGVSIGSLVQDLRGQYILYMDAGVIAKSGLINNCIHRVKVFRLSMLNLIPGRTLTHWMDYLIYPLNDFVLINLFPLRLAKLINSPSFSVGNQPCMFFSKQAFLDYLRLRGEDTDRFDHDIMRRFKQMKFKVEVLLAPRSVCYEDRSALTGTAGNLFRIFNNNSWIAGIYMLLVFAGPLVIGIDFNLYLLFLPFGLIFLSRIMISFLSDQSPVVNVLLHPLQMMMLIGMMCKEVLNRLLTIGRHPV